ELLAALRALRNFHARDAAVDGRHLDLAAERGGAHRDRHHAEDVGTSALEELVGLDREENTEVACRPAAQARIAHTGKADARAILDTRRNIHGQRPFAHDAARAGAGRARIVDDLAAPLAGRAGALDREEALGGTNLAEAGTRRA